MKIMMTVLDVTSLAETLNIYIFFLIYYIINYNNRAFIKNNIEI